MNRKRTIIAALFGAALVLCIAASSPTKWTDGYFTGTLEVDGAAQFDGAVTVTGAVTQTGGGSLALTSLTATNGTFTNTTTTVAAVTRLDIGGTQMTATAAELSALHSAGLSNAELSTLNGVAGTLTSTELNVLDGIAAGLSAAELSILDGVTVTAGQINAAGGGTTAYTTATTAYATLFDGAGAQFTTADINGGTVDAATIGGGTPGAGTFTTLAANTSAKVGSSGTVITGLYAGTGTITNSTTASVTIAGFAADDIAVVSLVDMTTQTVGVYCRTGGFDAMTSDVVTVGFRYLAITH